VVTCSVIGDDRSNTILNNSSDPERVTAQVTSSIFSNVNPSLRFFDFG
jgi:hypothetical protein